MNEIKQEYERLKTLFENVDENQFRLCEGAIKEAARLRCELDKLHEIVKQTGLIKVSADNSAKQKELPVSKMLTKVRANYINVIFKLSRILEATLNDEDIGLEDYE